VQVGEPHIIWVITVSFFMASLILGSILLLLLIVMHGFLCRLLDPILFREPWFNSTQLVMFDSWPLSYIKSMNYMFLIGFPNMTLRVSRFTNENWLTKRFSSRFKGMHLKDVPIVHSYVKTVCKVYTVVHLLTAIVGVSMFLFIAVVYAFDNWLT